jgi:hypothetical protein
VRCALVVIAVAAGCASKPPVVGDDLGGIEDELPGTCLDAGRPGADVEIRALDRDAVVFCSHAEASGAAPVCRKVELATGAMVEPSPVPPLAVPPEPADKVACTDHNVCHIDLCTGGTCKQLLPAAGEWFVRVARASDGRIAAGSYTAGQAAAVTVYDAKAVQTARFAVTWPIGDVVWLVNALSVMTSDGKDTRVGLFTADGDPLGLVGGDEGPIAVNDHVPMRVARTAYAWLSADAKTLAVHDVGKRVRGRIDLAITDLEPYVSAARGTPDGRVVIVLGGKRFGDVVIVEPGDGVMTTRPARRCDAPP